KLKDKLKVMQARLRHYSGICRTGPKQDLFAAYGQPLSYDDINHLYRKAGLGPPPPQAIAYYGNSAEALADFFLTYNPDPNIESFASQFLDGNIEPPHYPESDPSVNGINLYVLAILAK